jgi:hypothetical protein
MLLSQHETVQKYNNPITLKHKCMQYTSKQILVTQLVKKLSTFLEPEGSSPYLQEPGVGPYREPYASSSQISRPISLRSILILSSSLRSGLREDSALQVFETKTVYISHIFDACYMLHLSHTSRLYHSNNIF